MHNQILLVTIIAFSTLFGFWYKKSRGEIKTGRRKMEVSETEIGVKLGTRLTLLQFSSAFCSPCRTTRMLLSDLTKEIPDVKHIDIDAESRLELARKFNILSTPTTIILNANGQEIGRAVGVPKRSQILNLLEVFEI